MNIDEISIRPSKHFILGWMRKWDLDIYKLKDLLKRANITKVGKNKYEAFVRTKNKSIKIIFGLYEEEKEIFIIIGSEGK